MMMSACAKYSCACATTTAQALSSCGDASTIFRVVACDAGAEQSFLRQIEPADLGILVYVTQNVGELQRASEMMRERYAVLARHAETRTRSAVQPRSPRDRSRDRARRHSARG